MDNCNVDVITEFLAVAFHEILYYASVYPDSVFETRKKYSIVVHRCIHPEVEHYINLCLKNAAECIKNGQLSSLELAITDEEYEPVMKFVFNLESRQSQEVEADAYLIECEQNLRAYCLLVASCSHKFQALPEDCSFSILLHTNECTSVSLAANPHLEDFPLVELRQQDVVQFKQIIPLRRFLVRNCNLDTYIEIL